MIFFQQLGFFISFWISPKRFPQEFWLKISSILTGLFLIYFSENCYKASNNLVKDSFKNLSRNLWNVFFLIFEDILWIFLLGISYKKSFNISLSCFLNFPYFCSEIVSNNNPGFFLSKTAVRNSKNKLHGIVGGNCKTNFQRNI